MATRTQSRGLKVIFGEVGGIIPPKGGLGATGPSDPPKVLHGLVDTHPRRYKGQPRVVSDGENAPELWSP